MPTVLVVDDDELVRNLLVLLLDTAGYRVRAAADGEEALGLLQGGPPPDLILLDVQMPRVDGGRLLGRLRAGPWGAVPVVVMTGGGRDAGWAAERGAAGFLAKPFAEAALLAEVRRCLGLGGPGA